MTSESWPVDAGTALARALVDARDAREAGDRAGVDRHYPVAVRLASPPAFAVELAAEHVDAVRRMHDSTAALALCAGYRRRHPTATLLLLVEAETQVMQGDLSGLGGHLAELRTLTGGRPLPRREAALATRLAGLAAQYRGRFGPARTLLTDARTRYRALGDSAGVAEVERDLRRLDAREHADPAGAPDVEVPTSELSTAAGLARSEELRMAGRYEWALRVIREVRSGPVDPALAFVVGEAEIRLLRMLRLDEEAERMVPDLYAAADRSAQPEVNRALAARLDRPRLASATVVLPADRRLQQVRVLVEAGRLEDAERLLRAEAGSGDTRHEAEWHLTAGELALADGLRRGPADVRAVGQAITHLERAAELARQGTLGPIRIAALRLQARAHRVRGDVPAALRAAATAREHEDDVAGLQDSDEGRIRMLTGVVTEFDEQVRAAHEDAERGLRFAAASMAVAIEAGRGAAILPRIMPSGAPPGRELPPPGDGPGAWRWMRRALRGLPRGQTVWLLHVTPTGLHHVLARRWSLRYEYVGGCTRDDLRARVQALRRCWEAGGEKLVARAEEFYGHLHDLATRIGVDRVVAQLPRRTRRLAIVAGDELSDIPFAALPCPGARPGTRDLLGRRFALSDLPCLAVRQPLRGRARRQRGPGSLLVQPSPRLIRPVPAGEQESLTPAAPRRARTVLDRHEATPAALRETLASGVRTVRIDSHGTFGADTDPALFLWPVRRTDAPSGAGDLRPADLETMNLEDTGTLVVGACRSGMATRRGRDERIGFVRSGLLAGTSAVLAARWDAEDASAARLLDAFEDNLRHLPRDVALQRAMARVAADAPLGASGVVLWSGWTLYGDPGPQTRRGPLRSRLVRSWDAFRERAGRVEGRQ